MQRVSPEARSAGPIAPEIAWRDYFADPSLQALIARALGSNRDLKSAVLRVEEARAAYGIQRAEQFPTIAACIDGRRARTPGPGAAITMPRWSRAPAMVRVPGTPQAPSRPPTRLMSSSVLPLLAV